jgi:hypothetical protein
MRVNKIGAEILPSIVLDACCMVLCVIKHEKVEKFQKMTLDSRKC